MHRPSTTFEIPKPMAAANSTSMRRRILGGDGFGLALPRAEAEEKRPEHPQPIGEDEEPRAQRGLRRLQTRGREGAAERRGPFDDMAAREESDRGRALQLCALEGGGARRGLQVGPPGLLAAARPLEDLRETGAQPARMFARGRAVFEREPEEANSLVECHLGRGLLGGPFGVPGGALAASSGEVMYGDGFAVHARRLEGVRQASVILPQRTPLESRQDGLTEAIVHGLDHLLPVANSVSRQSLRSCERERLVSSVGDAGCLGDHRNRQGACGDGDDLGEAARGVRQVNEPLAHHLVHREGSASARRHAPGCSGCCVRAPRSGIDFPRTLERPLARFVAPPRRTRRAGRGPGGARPRRRAAPPSRFAIRRALASNRAIP